MLAEAGLLHNGAYTMKIDPPAESLLAAEHALCQFNTDNGISVRLSATLTLFFSSQLQLLFGQSFLHSS